ncbi:hypothetical protein MUN88_17610 [Gracilibacillus caseinilyticus]|uniref:Coupling factor for flagellin transcription and translation n=1 Tax=Gracilibacillus caseinilyticus TaxID=2932256 RepID=A0ABY4EW16_9BACI|nr:hypothetical protein [Gracilibacillus caseinilyticus]UOQ47849.1 hypothetical protein MUN88_17610 [Gracilibacillus caseinilyticus]
MQYLILFSFIIHIITFIIIRHLKNRIDNMHAVEERVDAQVKSIEDTLALYLVEIKEENEQFIQDIMNTQHSSTKNKPKNSPSTDSEYNTKQSENYIPISATDQVEDVVEHSLAASILHLRQQGLAVNQIAKQLNKGQTEVELILKFQQKK